MHFRKLTWYVTVSWFLRQLIKAADKVRQYALKKERDLDVDHFHIFCQSSSISPTSMGIDVSIWKSLRSVVETTMHWWILKDR